MKFKGYREYCTNCGLCASVDGVGFSKDDNGNEWPELSEKNSKLCSSVCPASGNALRNYQDGTIWGTYKRAMLGWSNDENIRFGAATGGVLTGLCIYLLENHIVDGVIQTRRSAKDIRKTETIVSRSKTDVLSCMGSRYTVSSPLREITSLIQEGETYAFVGKPCDVSSLRIYIKEFKPQWGDRIKYMLTFFCGGQPSMQANNKLIKYLGCKNLSDCYRLDYRGNGWPGQTTLTLKNGDVKTLDYETTWMKILGRGVRLVCRFCADGTGELADVACGDAWYLNSKDYPDFIERQGRNIIFSRTEAGDNLLKAIEKSAQIFFQEIDVEKDKVRKMQPYHYTRKASLIEYKYALKVCGRAFPNYDNKILRGFAKDFPVKQKILRFGGTIQRVIKGFI